MQIELNEVKYQDIHWIEELIEYTECAVIDRSWQSIHDKNIKKYLRPLFLLEEYLTNYQIIGEPQHLKFLQHMIDGRRSCNWFLEICLKLPN